MTFANPLMLLGLLAIAIPIAVHLFNFRRYRKVYFSNTRYLTMLQSETRRQSKLRRRLLLACRIIAIAMIALTFAQPTITPKEQKVSTGMSAVTVFVDNSYSMQGNSTEGQLLETARDKAREIAAAYKPDDNFQLLLSDCQGNQFRWLSRDEFLAYIDQIEPTAKGHSLHNAARRAADFLSHSGAHNRELYIISDFQQSAFQPEAMPTDSTISITLVPLQAASADNIYIDTVTLSAPVVQKGSHLTASARIVNAGNSTIEKAPLRLFVNGTQQAVASVDLPPHSDATVDLHFVATCDSALHCRVETTDYPISFDDRYYFSVDIQPPVNLTTIEGSKNANTALQRLFDGDSAIAYTTQQANNIDFSRLANANAIILDELGEIPSGLAQTLSTFVRNGGTLVVVPAANANIQSYNALLASLSAPTLDPMANNKLKASQVNLENRLYSQVFSGKTADMEMPTVTARYPMNTTGNTVREVIIQLADGTPALTATPCDGGLLYLWAMPLRPEYTDFTSQALFVPTLFNMALYSRILPHAAFTIGAPEPIPVNYPVGDADRLTPRLAALDTTYQTIPTLHHSGSQTIMLPPELPSDGNYNLTMAGSTLQALAFNYSRSESLMQFHSRSDLAKLIANYNLTNCSVVSNASAPLDHYIRQKRQGRPLWMWCLALALLALAAETALTIIPPSKK